MESKQKMKELKTKCVIAGHSKAELPHEGDEKHPDIIALKENIKKKLIELIEDGNSFFYCGMELGVELWSGEILIDLKKDNPHFTITSVIVSEKRAEFWSEEDRERYFDEVLCQIVTMKFIQF